ncbi:MAG: hypothetical protein ICV84_24780 [Flavisolibacter sp.]|nr:hypothetical protein [Flavisolibacter sp.]
MKIKLRTSKGEFKLGEFPKNPVPRVDEEIIVNRDNNKDHDRFRIKVRKVIYDYVISNEIILQGDIIDATPFDS